MFMDDALMTPAGHSSTAADRHASELFAIAA
jgi:hypothetical protein